MFWSFSFRSAFKRTESKSYKRIFMHLKIRSRINRIQTRLIRNCNPTRLSPFEKSRKILAKIPKSLTLPRPQISPSQKLKITKPRLSSTLKINPLKLNKISNKRLMSQKNIMKSSQKQRMK